MSNQNPFSDIIHGEIPVLVDFFATWCGPCKMMPPILQELKSQLGNRIRILKIDIDKNQQVSNNYQIHSVPTLVLFHSGKIVWRTSGVLTAHAIQKEIQQYLPV